IGRAIRPGRLIADRNGSGPPLTDAEILAASGTMFHPSCTCAIGRADDPMAVVDPECRVYGVASLRVADASVLPSVPSANTNFPTIMIAERVADFIRAHADPAERRQGAACGVGQRKLAAASHTGEAPASVIVV